MTPDEIEYNKLTNVQKIADKVLENYKRKMSNPSTKYESAFILAYHGFLRNIQDQIDSFME